MHALNLDSLLSGFQRLTKLIDIGPRTATGLERQDEMITGIAHDAQLGIAMIDDLFPSLTDTGTAFDEVRTGRRALQPGRIDRSQRDACLAFHDSMDGLVK